MANGKTYGHHWQGDPLAVTSAASLQGKIAHGGPAGLAISVNGMIRATTRTYIIDGFENRFEAMLPPDSLIPGANDLRVFLVTEAPGGFRLAEIPKQAP
jgi:hypothetical protein